MGNTFGTLFRITTFGESHGGAVGVVVDGCPPGIAITENDIQKELDRRKPGQSKITTPRKEQDTIHILSGVFEGKTTGTPIMMCAYNKDVRPEDYNELKKLYRPGHADFTFTKKYGTLLVVGLGGVLIVALLGILFRDALFYGQMEMENNMMNEEKDSQYSERMLPQLHGTITQIEEVEGGVNIILSVTLPVSAQGITQEEYDSYTPETFPQEITQHQFFISSSLYDERSLFENTEITVVFSENDGNEYKKVVEILWQNRE